MQPASQPQNAFAALRRLATARSRLSAGVADEKCELCSVPLAPEHRHLLEIATRKIVCSCDACALRFPAEIGGRFKIIPRDTRTLPDFQMSDAEWENFALPINLVFFFKSSPHEKMVALYPSPAGATESLLPLASWQNLVAENSALARMEPDVEALLVNRVGEAREYFIAPMDVCFELVGLIRVHWRGLSGGDAVWQEIEAFFAKLKMAANPLPEPISGLSEPEKNHA